MKAGVTYPAPVTNRTPRLPKGGARRRLKDLLFEYVDGFAMRPKDFVETA